MVAEDAGSSWGNRRNGSLYRVLSVDNTAIREVALAAVDTV